VVIVVWLWQKQHVISVLYSWKRPHSLSHWNQLGAAKGQDSKVNGIVHAVDALICTMHRLKHREMHRTVTTQALL